MHVEPKSDHCGIPHSTTDGKTRVSLNDGILERAWKPLEVHLGSDLQPASENSTNSSSSTVEDFPEGGRAAWLSLAGCFCAWMASFGLMNTVGTFQAYLQTHQLSAYSEAEVGWIFGLYLFMAYCCGVQAGPIFDAVGPRALTAAGSVCQVLSMFLLGTCSSKYLKDD